MRSHFSFDGGDFDLDTDGITVRQLDVIKATFQFGFLDLMRGVAAGDPDALRAIFWIAKTQSQKPAGDMRTYDFAVAPFFDALHAGIVEEATPASATGEQGEDADPPLPAASPSAPTPTPAG